MTRLSDLIEAIEILSVAAVRNEKWVMDTEAKAPAAPAAVLKNNEAKPSPPRKRGGKRPGAGRKKGVPNKLTANVKAAIMAAFAAAGGKDYLVKVAKTDPRTFCTLLGKLLPTQVTGDAADEPVRIQVSWLPPTQRPSLGAREGDTYP
jgi:hypothetical protein